MGRTEDGCIFKYYSSFRAMDWRKRDCFCENQFGGCRLVALDSEGDSSSGDQGHISEVQWKGGRKQVTQLEVRNKAFPR